MDFSEFLKKKSYITIPPGFNLKDAEFVDNHFFNGWIKRYPETQHEVIKERLAYIRQYNFPFSDYDLDQNYSPSLTPYNHYRTRDLKLKNTGLSEKDFFDFDIMQEAIADLGLSPVSTFEFILFLWDELWTWLNVGKTEFSEKRMKEAFNLMDKKPEEKVELDIKIGKKHFIFKNERFVKSILASFISADIAFENQTETLYPTKREIDYILVKTLLDKLPIRHSKEKKGNYTQAERNFALCVLWLTGELNHKRSDDPYFFCTKENNATFDKLMRDYKGLVPPPIIPLF